MDRLLNLALPFAQQMLAKHGEFFPYAMATSQDGQDRMIGGYTGIEKPPSAELLSLLYDGLRARAADERAAAVVADVRLRTPETAAIQVELEHRDGVSLTVHLPYRKKPLGGALEYGQISAAAGRCKIWPLKS
jgi:hypothetical protein